MSSDFENFLLRPGGCCQNRLLYRVTQCCFQALPEAKYRGTRKTNRSYWGISELSEKFGSVLIPVKLREGWSRKIFPNQISQAKALSRQACVNFTTVLHSWSGPGRLCIQPDNGKDDAHTECMEKCSVDTSSRSAPSDNRLPWNCMFFRSKSSLFFCFVLFCFCKHYKHFTELHRRAWQTLRAAHTQACLLGTLLQECSAWIWPAFHIIQTVEYQFWKQNSPNILVWKKNKAEFALS